jgi:hypothetical protein
MSSSCNRHGPLLAERIGIASRKKPFHVRELLPALLQEFDKSILDKEGVHEQW